MTLEELLDPRQQRLLYLTGPEGVSEACAMVNQPMPRDLLVEAINLEAELQLNKKESNV